MLLEYFMSSGQPGTLDDARITVSKPFSTVEKPAADNNAEFKRALNNSLNERAKYLNNQVSRSYSESNLLSDIKHWDSLYSQTEAHSDIDLPNTEYEINPVASDQIVTQANEVPTKLVIGDIVPTNGKELPGNKEFNTTNEAAKDIVTEKSRLNPIKTETLNSPSQNTATKSILDNTLTSAEKQLNDKSQQTTADLKPNKTDTEKLIVATTSNTDSKDKLQTILGQDKILKQAVKTEHETTSKANIDTQKAIATNNSAATLSKEFTQTKNNEQLTKEALIQQKPATLLSENAHLATRRELPLVNSNPSSVTEKMDVPNNNLQGKLTLDAKFGNNSPAISTVKEQNNLNIQILDKDNNNLKSENLVADIVKNKQFENATVPESNRSELMSQSESQSQNSKSTPVVEQLLKHNARINIAANLLPNVFNGSDPSAASSTKIPEMLINDVATISQIQQTSNNQNTIRTTDVALAVSVPTQKWNQKFAEHVSMLTLRGATNAQIRLDPPELGPMSIRITHQANETQIQFVVNNPIARELVDSGTQRLREMLEQHGFDNVDVDVNEFTKGEQSDSGEENADHEIDNLIDEKLTTSEIISERNVKSSLIDLFA